MFNPVEALLREIEALKKKVQKLEDDQIKQNRDYKDMIYNLDTDNIPKLQAVVKKVNLVVSEDGNVTAEFIMEVVNNSSNVRIKADRIDLKGATLNLTSDKIKIVSDNFSVDEMGHVVMESADIKSNCIIASDLGSETGAVAKIGTPYEDEIGNKSESYIRGFTDYDGAGAGEYRGVALESSMIRQNDKAFINTLEMGLKRFKMSACTGDMMAEIGLERVGEGADGIISPYIRAVNQYGDEFAFWIDNDGIHTTAHSIDFGATSPF